MMIKSLLLCLVGMTLLSAVSCSSGSLKKQQAQFHLRIGTGFLNQGRNPQALTELLTAEELDPDEPGIQNNLGLAYYARKEYPLAETHLKKAIALYPKFSDARNNLGRLYTDLGRYDEALSHLILVSRDLTYPAPEKAFLNLGLVYLRKGDFVLSQSNFKKSMQSNVHFCPAYNYYGQALFQQQKYTEAIDSFEQALSLCNNNYDEAHYYSALSYYKLGETDRAITRLEEVERRYPESEYAIKAKSMLKIIR
jgi:type IV pilus assembly protein PilF